jgi:hypothetical protein
VYPFTYISANHREQAAEREVPLKAMMHDREGENISKPMHNVCK